jgi:hypothetical protein
LMKMKKEENFWCVGFSALPLDTKIFESDTKSTNIGTGPLGNDWPVPGASLLKLRKVGWFLLFLLQTSFFSLFLILFVLFQLNTAFSPALLSLNVLSQVLWMELSDFGLCCNLFSMFSSLPLRSSGFAPLFVHLLAD